MRIAAVFVAVLSSLLNLSSSGFAQVSEDPEIIEIGLAADPQFEDLLNSEYVSLLLEDSQGKFIDQVIIRRKADTETVHEYLKYLAFEIGIDSLAILPHNATIEGGLQTADQLLQIYGFVGFSFAMTLRNNASFPYGARIRIAPLETGTGAAKRVYFVEFARIFHTRGWDYGYPSDAPRPSSPTFKGEYNFGLGWIRSDNLAFTLGMKTFWRFPTEDLYRQDPSEQPSRIWFPFARVSIKVQ